MKPGDSFQNKSRDVKNVREAIFCPERYVPIQNRRKGIKALLQAGEGGRQR